MFLILRACFCIGLSLSIMQTSYASGGTCDKYTQQIRKLEDQRHSGGKANQMNRWANKLNELEDERFHCLNDPDRNPKIQTVSGSSQYPRKKAATSDHQKTPETSVALSLSNIEKPKRKLSECIKPNQLIDKEVNDCLQGLIEPNWK